MTKIDLESISGCANALNTRIAHAESDRNSSLMIPKHAAKEIAAALEQLPKLVEALRELHDAYAYCKGDETVKQSNAIVNAAKALEPFQTQPQG